MIFFKGTLKFTGKRAWLTEKFNIRKIFGKTIIEDLFTLVRIVLHLHFTIIGQELFNFRFDPHHTTYADAYEQLIQR